VFSGYSAFVGANGSHESSTNGGFGETPQYFIKGYSLLDLRAGIESADDNWRLAIWGRNVTNEYYWTGVNLGIDTVSRYAGRPATFGFTFSYRYR
jgi:outer membrane receptor protein involved in Fe transport